MKMIVNMLMKREIILLSRIQKVHTILARKNRLRVIALLVTDKHHYV
jgi:hypothetical protein